MTEVGRSQLGDGDKKSLEAYKEDANKKKEDKPKENTTKSTVPDYVTPDSTLWVIGNDSTWRKN